MRKTASVASTASTRGEDECDQVGEPRADHLAPGEDCDGGDEQHRAADHDASSTIVPPGGGAPGSRGTTAAPGRRSAAIPNSSITSFEDELEGRSVNQPAAINQTLSVPEYLPEWSGEAGHLRRQAISYAINREEITDTIFNGTRTPGQGLHLPR
ncbi:hypothetical protein [Georgenia sp. SUBG003]|uniref:hypothetical protein n=1 Tax=Georgenia sp. SUBG003 TaxID=1497974 RepID=UPI003AB29479